MAKTQNLWEQSSIVYYYAVHIVIYLKQVSQKPG